MAGLSWLQPSALKETLNRATSDLQVLAEKGKGVAASTVQQVQGGIESLAETTQETLQEVGEGLSSTVATAATTLQSTATTTLHQGVGNASSVLSGLEAKLHGISANTRTEFFSEGELAKQFVWEARAVREQSPEVAIAVLERWESRLHEGDMSGKECLWVFLRSRALDAALAAFAEVPELRVVLRDAGGLPQDVLVRLCHAASSEQAPRELLAKLLVLLAEAAEAADKSRGSFDEQGIEGSTRSISWVLALISGCLVDNQEAEILKAQPTVKLMKQALEETSLETKAESAEVSDKTGTMASIPAGSEVWALWPGDGLWYHAKIKSVTGTGFEVIWLRPPAGTVDAAKEYVMSAGHEDTCFTQVTAANVAPPGSGRPEPVAMEGNSVDLWRKKVEVAENMSRRCREVHNLLMEQGKLSDAGATPLGAESLGLGKLLTQLKEMRTERQARAESLVGLTAKCAEAEEGCQKQLRNSSDTFREELEGLQKRQAESNNQIETLRKERAELKERLKALDAQLKELQETSAELSRNEHRLMGNMENCSQELCNRLSTEETRQTGLAEQRRVIVGILEAASKVEAGIEARAVAASTACRERESISNTQIGLFKACQAREAARLAAIEELCACWHGVVWGPDSKSLQSNLQKLEELRGALKHGAGLVERAWRDSVQLAADSLGDNSDGADDVSKAASDTGARYKELGTQLQGDLTRVTGWVNNCPTGSAAKSSPKTTTGKPAPAAGYPQGQSAPAPVSRQPPQAPATATPPSGQPSPAPTANDNVPVSPSKEQEIAEDDAE